MEALPEPMIPLDFAIMLGYNTVWRGGRSGGSFVPQKWTKSPISAEKNQPGKLMIIMARRRESRKNEPGNVLIWRFLLNSIESLFRGIVEVKLRFGRLVA